MYRNFAFALLGLALLSPVRAAAQEQEILNLLYGSGVHAYFNGDYRQAHEDLTTVIERGTEDPRPYYFRALAHLQLGRPDEARDDMNRGAKLEAEDVDGFYPVSRSLERIQGRERLLLERYRVKARLAELQRRKALEKKIYERRQTRRGDVLREQIPRLTLEGEVATDVPDEGEATADLPAAKEKKTATTEPKSPEDPFGTEPEKPTATEPSDPDDPFASEPEKKEPAAADNPFGEPAAPEKKEPAGGADDPFGEPEDKAKEPAGADNPFGEPEPEKKKPAEAGADNPFGEPVGGEKEKMKADGADIQPGDLEENPFSDDNAVDGAEKPAEKAGEDDNPFGGGAAEPEAKGAEEPAAEPAEKPENTDDDDNPFGEEDDPFG